MDNLQLAQSRLDMKLWQKENETWRTDFTDIDNDIKVLQKEIKQRQTDLDWNSFMENRISKIVPRKSLLEIDEYDTSDEVREAEEATQIALSNLGQHDHE